MEDNSVKGYVLTALINCGISQKKTKEVLSELEMLLSEISPDQAAMFYERVYNRENGTGVEQAWNSRND